MTERKPMPLVHLDAPFPVFEDVVPHIEDLTMRSRSYIAQEPPLLSGHPYRDLTVAVWLQRVPNGYYAHLMVAERAFVKSECPADGLAFDLSELLKKKEVRLRDVYTYLKSEAWLQLLLSEYNIRWLNDNAVD
ncbi:hypothetical protein [Rhizobium sp. 1399]|uniref:hypothetical protein n=1 Tax=Rhizobium sp. 1399 TaxID=2817758 RepID=UPI00285E21FA|nr:hypothetical protein [Rhizobium sp. 1399]MDR6664021.1 hypothetical protein [Rhizobium sp. 1399]